MVVIRIARVVVGVAREQPLVHVHSKRHGEAASRHISEGKALPWCLGLQLRRATNFIQDKKAWLQVRLLSGTHVLG